ncbi:hypothetical protein EDB19DRAFT_1663859, partial [Suillus lakei]
MGCTLFFWLIGETKAVQLKRPLLCLSGLALRVPHAVHVSRHDLVRHNFAILNSVFTPANYSSKVPIISESPMLDTKSVGALNLIMSQYTGKPLRSSRTLAG